MTEKKLSTSDDAIYPFVINETALRGRVARLNLALDTILKQHGYPTPVSNYLGELVVLVTMLAESLKLQGMMTMQVKSEGAIKLLIADYMPGGKIRGYAGINKERYQDLLASKTEDSLKFEDLFSKGYLAITIDPGEGMERYQGIVELQGDNLSECVEAYFAQSEQIETVISVAVGQHYSPATGTHWRGGGLMVQQLPEMGGKPHTGLRTQEDWEKVEVFVRSIKADELIDPELSPQGLLLRLFHEEGVWVYDPSMVKHGCRCSREKAENILRSIPKDELEALKDEGKIEVTCEFCNTTSVFTDQEINAL